MKLPRKFVLTLSAIIAIAAGRPVLAGSQSYNGSSDGNTNFNSAVASGTLSATDDGSGGIIFSLVLGNGQTNFGGNAFVLYIDTGVGGGISSTSALTDTQDGARKAVSEFTATDNGGNPGRSTLNFNGLLTPEDAITLDAGFADVFSLGTTSNFAFTGGAAANGAGQDGVTYTFASGVASVDIPAADLGLTPFTADTLTFFGIQVSETGYSSTEVIGTSTGNGGWGNTQNVTGADEFTVVPEASSMGLLACGLGMLLLGNRIRRQVRA